MYESQDKLVSHPGHYQSKTGLEVIDVIEAFTDGLEGIEAVDTGNVIKYICRWKKKNGLQDLEKALWYLQHLVDHLKATPDPKADIESERTTHYRCRHCGCEFAIAANRGIADLLNHLWAEHHFLPIIDLDNGTLIEDSNSDFINENFEQL